jgi:exodeoxyribonuclease VII small subunit
MKEKTYTENFEALTKIVKELERGDIAIDSMTQKISLALELLEKCKASLQVVNEDVNKIMEEINIANETQE